MSSCSLKPQRLMPSKFAHAMRSAELTLAMKLLPAGGRILELGAGDGWQASILVQHGFLVSAIDVASVSPETTRYAPVTIYDGLTLPFADGIFDAVFSSNVLEHVKDFERTQAELARVLKPGGMAVHCVPTAIWRFWTTAGHPLYALRWLLNSNQHESTPPNNPQNPTAAAWAAGNSVLGLLRAGLIAPRHGEYGNLLSEHYLFSRRSWKHRFNQAGWQIAAVHPTGLFYSGNELLGTRLAVQIRRQIARLLGSSTSIFVLLPRSPDPATHP